MLTINPNLRPNPILQTREVLRSETCQRVCDIALPFLNLHAPTAHLLSVGMGTARVYQLLQSSEWKQSARSAMECASAILCLGMTIASPIAGTILSLTIRMGEHTYQLALHLTKNEFDQFGKELLKAAGTAIYLTSVVSGASALIVLSISIQALYELGASYGSYQEGKWPETLANLVLALIRLHGAKPHFSRARREYFGKELTQEDAIHLLNRAEELQKQNPRRAIDFESLLAEENFSNIVKNIDYTAEKRLSNIHFIHIQFKTCNFTETEIDGSAFNACRFSKANFQRAHIENTRFTNCVLDNARWIDACIQNSFFRNCSFNDAVFFHNAMNRVTFDRSSFKRAYFNDSSLKDVHWKRSQLGEAVFLGVATEGSGMKQCDLTNTILCEAEETLALRSNIRKITKPVVSITWDFSDERHFSKMICEKLKDNGIIPLKYQANPLEIDTDLLAEEVQAGLTDDIGEARSRGEALLLNASPDSQIGKLFQNAGRISCFVHAHLLPGGHDIEPEFYGKERAPETYTEETYTRTLLELSLLHHAEQTKQQVMGICRGSQMINVFYGGTLRQHVDDQHGMIQNLRPASLESERLEELRETLFGPGSLCAISMHHQCADTLGTGLHLLFETEDGVPKAWIDETGRVLGTQFHPELYEHMIQSSDYIDELLQDGKFIKDLPPQKLSYFQEIALGLRESSPFLHGLFQRLA